MAFARSGSDWSHKTSFVKPKLSNLSESYKLCAYSKRYPVLLTRDPIGPALSVHPARILPRALLASNYTWPFPIGLSLLCTSRQLFSLHRHRLPVSRASHRPAMAVDLAGRGERQAGAEGTLPAQMPAGICCTGWQFTRFAVLAGRQDCPAGRNNRVPSAGRL
jgi:hypothetical protein